MGFVLILPIVAVSVDYTAFLSAGQFVEISPTYILQAPTELPCNACTEPHDIADFGHEFLREIPRLFIVCIEKYIVV